LLNHLKNKISFFGNVVTLGKQSIIINKSDYKKLFKDKEYPNEKYLDKFLVSEFKASSVDCLDFPNYEGANLIVDLNYIQAFKKKYDLLIDFGTSEHISNIYNALINYKNLVKLGGTIIHSVPCNNWIGHGFYQFSPEFFENIYSEKSGFKVEIFLALNNDHDHWYKILPKPLGTRFNGSSIVKTSLIVVAQKISHITLEDHQQSDYIVRWHKEDNSKISQELRFDLKKQNLKS